jgi:circadian clock protein KaiC
MTTPAPLVFSPVRELMQGALPYGSAWLVQGEPGVGKSTLAYQFVLEGLRRREGVLHIAADAPSVQVRQAILRFGFLADPYLEEKQLVIRDIFGEGDALDLNDPEAFLFSMLREVERMPKPLRLVFDSLTPLALGYTPSDFVALVHRQIRMLRRPDVAIFCTLLRETLQVSDHYSLLNAFDVVLDLYVPDWGEMRLTGNVGYRAIQVRKARGIGANTQSFPYTLSSTEGLVIHKEFYRRQEGDH